jgi:hypothetical protein
MKRLAFLGPSRPARIPSGVTVLPPARQGDVWRALEKKPRAIALIDGVFEHQPSVWHREILDALAEGVTVFGAASMGALRAAELARFGMKPVGAIARDYLLGRRVDDGDVALLHADASHGFRPLTVPLADAQHAIAAAKRARVVTPQDAAALLRCAEALHYSDRTWGRLTRDAEVQSQRWRSFVLGGPPSLKQHDALLCLRALVAARGTPKPRPYPGGSSFQRRARLAATGRPVPPPSRAELAGLAALAARLNINPALEPSGFRGIAHRLLHDGLLTLSR